MTTTAILYTTFLREDLALRTLRALCHHSPPDTCILAGNQTFVKDVRLLAEAENLKEWGYVMDYLELPFDCGLSYVRNYLVHQAWLRGFEYCLVTADSIMFTSPYDLGPVTRFMSTRPECILVGLQLHNRVPWEFDIELTPGESFRLIMPQEETIQESGVMFRRVGICKNFFIAKTELLRSIPWDEELKLCEHEDWFYRVKKAGYKCYITDCVSAEYIDEKPPEYAVMRKRMYKEFRVKLLKKYGIYDWCTYSPEVVRKMQEFRRG